MWLAQFSLPLYRLTYIVYIYFYIFRVLCCIWSSMLILLFTNWIQLTLVFRLIIYSNYSLYKSVRDYYGLFIALLSKFVRFVICAMFACVCVYILSYIALFIVTTWPPIQLSTRIGLTICNWPVTYMFIPMCVCVWVSVCT